MYIITIHLYEYNDSISLTPSFNLSLLHPILYNTNFNTRCHDFQNKPVQLRASTAG